MNSRLISHTICIYVEILSLFSLHICNICILSYIRYILLLNVWVKIGSNIFIPKCIYLHWTGWLAIDISTIMQFKFESFMFHLLPLNVSKIRLPFINQINAFMQRNRIILFRLGSSTLTSICISKKCKHYVKQ